MGTQEPEAQTAAGAPRGRRDEGTSRSGGARGEHSARPALTLTGAQRAERLHNARAADGRVSRAAVVLFS